MTADRRAALRTKGVYKTKEKRAMINHPIYKKGER